MPSNIFATTGTNVSVVFIDKDGGDKITLVDASKLGEKTKEGKNQRTILSPDEERQIVEAFNSDEAIEDFSVHPTIDEAKKKNYSLSAGQYFEINVQHVDITEPEFKSRLDGYRKELDELFTQSKELGQSIGRDLEKLNYGD